MLDLMRKHARNWMMKALLGIIIVVFIFYFGSMGGRQKADALATIDKKTISTLEFQKEYQDLVEMYRKRLGGRLTEDMLKALKIKEQVLDKMIYEAILMKKAQELRIAVSDEELRNLIASTPAFQRNGVFDEQQYQQMLRYNRMKPEDFESMQKKNIVVAKLEDLLQDGISVSDTEVYDFYKITNEKMSVSWIRLPVNDFRKEVQPSTADLEKYLKEHGNDFRVPDQIRIKYALFAGQAYAGGVTVTNDEIQEAYSRLKGQQGKADKIPPLNDIKDKLVNDIKKSKGLRVAYEAAKKAHDTIYQQNNFDAYTAQNHLPVESTGFFSAKNPPQAFREINDFNRIAFSLQKNEISNILSSDEGYYLFMLLEKKAAYTPPLKEVETDLRQRFLENESRRLARQESQRLLEKMKSGGSLHSIAAAKKLTVSETDFFLPANPPAQLGSSPELRRSLFQLSAKKPYADQAFDVGGAFVLIELKERAKVDDSEFAKQKAGLKDTLLRIKKSESIQSWMQSTKAAMIKEGRIKFLKEVKDL